MSKYQAKAQELVNKFREFADGTDSETDRYSPGVEKEKAKQCALIAVDEMINYFSKETFMMAYLEIAISEVNYWQEVKQELLKK